MDINAIVAIIALIFTGAGMLGAVARMLMARMDTQADALHRRISDLRNDVVAGYVPRETFEIRMGHITHTLTEISSDVKALLRSSHSPTIAAE